MFNLFFNVFDTITYILTFKLNTSKIYQLTLCPSVDIVCFWIFFYFKMLYNDNLY